MLTIGSFLALSLISKTGYEGTFVASSFGVSVVRNNQVVEELPNYIVRQWVPKLHSFLCANLGPNEDDYKVYKWQPGHGKPQVFYDFGRLVPALASIDTQHQFLFSLSPDLSTLAVYTGGYATYHLRFVDLASNKVRALLDDNAISHGGLPANGCRQEKIGLAWTPDGSAIAVGVGGDAGLDDGTGRTECMLVTTSGRATYLGRGVPIAWLDSQHLLCGRQPHYNAVIVPEILFRHKSKPRIGKSSGIQIAYDGKNIFVVMGKTCQELNSSLKPIKQFAVKGFGFGDSFDPDDGLLALPKF